MESPVRKMQKKNDYNRHKLFRKIARRRRNAAKQMSTIAEKQLRRQMRIPSFDDGKDANRRLRNDYPTVTYEELNSPDLEQYFANNPNVAGMAIGGGLNGIDGPRRVVINESNPNMKNPQNRQSVEANERVRHYLDEGNFNIKATRKQRKYYNLPEFEGSYKGADDTTIVRTDIARYLSGDAHQLSKRQMKKVDDHFKNIDIYDDGKDQYGPYGINPELVPLNPGYDYLKDKDGYYNIHVGERGGTYKLHKIDPINKTGTTYVNGEEYTVALPDNFFSTGNSVEDALMKGPQRHDKPLEAVYPEAIIAGTGRAIANGAVRTAYNLVKPAMENQTVQNLFAADAAYRQGLTDEGLSKTIRLIGEGNYGEAALSGAGDFLDLTMMAPTLYRGTKEVYGLTKRGLNWANKNYVLPYRTAQKLPLSLNDAYMKAVREGDVETAIENVQDTNYKLDVLKSTAQASLLNSPKSMINWFRQRVLKNYDDPYKLTFVDDNDVLDAYLKRATSKGLPKLYFKNIPIHYYDLPGFDKVLLQYIEDTPEFKNLILDLWGNVEEGTKALLDEIKGNAGALPGFGIAMPSTPENVLALDHALEGASKNTKLVLGHEMEHFLHHPLEALPEQLREAFGGEDYYFNDNNNTEVGARISQMLNKFGITSTKNRTGDWYKKLMERYIQLNGLNNNISQLYKTILHVPNGWDMLAKWANNPLNVYSLVAPAAIATGLGTAAQSKQQALEGNINKHNRGKDVNTSRFTLIQPKKK